jgi:hypothetical protein
MRCPICGLEDQDSVSWCRNCGADLSPSSPLAHISVHVKKSLKARISLILGIIGFSWLFFVPFFIEIVGGFLGVNAIFSFGILVGILTIIFGILALRDIKKSKGALYGYNVALVGIVLGILIFFIIFRLWLFSKFTWQW